MGWLMIQVYLVCPFQEVDIELQYSTCWIGDRVGAVLFLITFRQILHWILVMPKYHPFFYFILWWRMHSPKMPNQNYQSNRLYRSVWEGQSNFVYRTGLCKKHKCLGDMKYLQINDNNNNVSFMWGRGDKWLGVVHLYLSVNFAEYSSQGLVARVRSGPAKPFSEYNWQPCEAVPQPPPA